LTTLIVSSADERYFALAKGLVLSLRACGLPNDAFDCRFIDIGCSEASLAWLAEHGVGVARLGRDVLDQFNAAGGPAYYAALVCRPLLPEIFPGYRSIVWIDADCWVQHPTALQTLAAAAEAYPDKVLLSPECHYSYLRLNQDVGRVDLLRAYYTTCFGAEVGDHLGRLPMYNSGLFAMAADGPIWAEWRDVMKDLYAREIADPTIRHLADQLAMNFLVKLRNCAIPVDPALNYLCLFATPFRDRQDVVRVALPPNFPLSIIHLAQWFKHSKRYLERGLLFDRGRYLSEAELAALSEAAPAAPGTGEGAAAQT
jgi:hypothetical protein